MSTTLRRKMFKMGGKVDAHGVGITSGLEKRTGMNQGGRVDRGIVGYQPNNHPARQGNREGHSGSAASWLINKGLNIATAGVPRAIEVIKFIKNTPEGLKLINKYGFSQAKKIAEAAAKARSTTGGATSYLGGNIGQAARLAKEMQNSGITQLAGQGFKNAIGRNLTGGIARELALGAVPVAAIGGVGLGLSDRIGLTEKGNDDSLGEDIARSVTGGALDLGTGAGLGTKVVQALRNTEESPKQGSLYDLIAGNPAEKTSEQIPLSDIMSVADREEKAYEEMQTEASRRAEEMYTMLNGGVNKMAAISAGLAAATPYIANEQYAEGAAAFSQGIQPEIQADENLKSQIGGQVLSEMAAEKEAEDKYVQASMAQGDGTTATEARRLFRADREIGLDNIRIAEIIDGRISVTEPGVYLDKSNASGKLYIAVNQGKEVGYFDDVNKAVEFANTTVA